jgi:hypothetical protein
MVDFKTRSVEDVLEEAGVIAQPARLVKLTRPGAHSICGAA